jgi:hypothetical protein
MIRSTSSLARVSEEKKSKKIQKYFFDSGNKHIL